MPVDYSSPSPCPLCQWDSPLLKRVTNAWLLGTVDPLWMVYDLSPTCLLMDMQNASSYVWDQEDDNVASLTPSLCACLSLQASPEVRLVGSEDWALWTRLDTMEGPLLLQTLTSTQGCQIPSSPPTWRVWIYLGFLGFFPRPGFMAYRIQFPNQGSNLWPWKWKLRVLTTGQLGNSPTGLVFIAKRQGIFRTTFKGLFTPSFWLQNWTNEEKSIKQGMFWDILVFPKLINKNVALCLCMCGWVPLLSTWNYHNSVNRLQYKIRS